MTQPIRLKAANIQCLADEYGAKERPITVQSTDYIVLAHDQESADNAARLHYYGQHQSPADDRQESLPL